MISLDARWKPLLVSELKKLGGWSVLNTTAFDSNPCAFPFSTAIHTYLICWEDMLSSIWVLINMQIFSLEGMQTTLVTFHNKKSRKTRQGGNSDLSVSRRRENPWMVLTPIRNVKSKTDEEVLSAVRTNPWLLRSSEHWKYQRPNSLKKRYLPHI